MVSRLASDCYRLLHSWVHHKYGVDFHDERAVTGLGQEVERYILSPRGPGRNIRFLAANLAYYGTTIGRGVSTGPGLEPGSGTDLPPREITEEEE